MITGVWVNSIWGLFCDLDRASIEAAIDRYVDDNKRLFFI